MLTIVGKRIGTDTNWKQNSTEFISDDIDTIEINGIRLTVDRLCELADAERDGRVVVLPCKVGTPIFFIRTFCKHADDTGYCNVDLWYARKGYKRENGCSECPNKNLKKRVRESTFSLSLMDAKKVGHLHVSEIYFNREEAEAARALAEPKGEATT